MEENLTKPLNRIELQAEIIRQEHRLFPILKNFFYNRSRFPEGDPRREACVHAFFWRLSMALMPTAAAASIGITSIIALLISLKSVTSLEDQNLIELRANLFTHALNMQKIWIEHPELYDYFYKNKKIEENIDLKDKRRLLIMAEMLADMLDHAAASNMTQIQKEGWPTYAKEMYSTSPIFRDFLNSSQDWYPSVGKWIDFERKTNSTSP